MRLVGLEDEFDRAMEEVYKIEAVRLKYLVGWWAGGLGVGYLNED
jgi:hypothetical protein